MWALLYKKLDNLKNKVIPLIDDSEILQSLYITGLLSIKAYWGINIYYTDPYRNLSYIQMQSNLLGIECSYSMGGTYFS